MPPREKSPSKKITQFWDETVIPNFPESHLETLHNFITHGTVHGFTGAVMAARSPKYPHDFNHLARMVQKARDSIRQARENYELAEREYENAMLFSPNPRAALMRSKNATYKDEQKVLQHLERIQKIREKEHNLIDLLRFLMRNRAEFEK